MLNLHYKSARFSEVGIIYNIFDMSLSEKFLESWDGGPPLIFTFVIFKYFDKLIKYKI